MGIKWGDSTEVETTVGVTSYFDTGEGASDVLDTTVTYDIDSGDSTINTLLKKQGSYSKGVPTGSSGEPVLDYSTGVAGVLGSVYWGKDDTTFLFNNASDINDFSITLSNEFGKEFAGAEGMISQAGDENTFQNVLDSLSTVAEMQENDKLITLLNKFQTKMSGSFAVNPDSYDAADYLRINQDIMDRAIVPLTDAEARAARTISGSGRAALRSAVRSGVTAVQFNQQGRLASNGNKSGWSKGATVDDYVKTEAELMNFSGTLTRKDKAARKSMADTIKTATSVTQVNDKLESIKTSSPSTYNIAYKGLKVQEVTTNEKFDEATRLGRKMLRGAEDTIKVSDYAFAKAIRSAQKPGDAIEAVFAASPLFTFNREDTKMNASGEGGYNIEVDSGITDALLKDVAPGVQDEVRDEIARLGGEMTQALRTFDVTYNKQINEAFESGMPMPEPDLSAVTDLRNAMSRVVGKLSGYTSEHIYNATAGVVGDVVTVEGDKLAFDSGFDVTTLEQGLADLKKLRKEGVIISASDIAKQERAIVRAKEMGRPGSLTSRISDAYVEYDMAAFNSEARDAAKDKYTNLTNQLRRKMTGLKESIERTQSRLSLAMEGGTDLYSSSIVGRNEAYAGTVDTDAMKKAGQLDNYNRLKKDTRWSDAEIALQKTAYQNWMMASGDAKLLQKTLLDNQNNRINERINNAKEGIDSFARTKVLDGPLASMKGDGTRSWKLGAIFSSLLTLGMPIFYKLYWEPEMADKASDRAIDKMRADLDARAEYYERVHGVNVGATGGSAPPSATSSSSFDFTF